MLNGIGKRIVGTIAMALLIAIVGTGSSPVCAQDTDTSGASFMKRLNQELTPTSIPDSARGATTAAPVQPATAGIVELLSRIFGYLAILVLIILVIAWAVRRAGIAGKGKIGGGAMDLLEVLPLGQSRTLLLVRVSDRVFMLGQTPDQISKIDSFEGEKAVELITASKGGGILPFKDAFNNFMSKMVRKPS